MDRIESTTENAYYSLLHMQDTAIAVAMMVCRMASG
jgi:hypothetical protein